MPNLPTSLKDAILIHFFMLLIRWSNGVKNNFIYSFTHQIFVKCLNIIYQTLRCSKEQDPLSGFNMSILLQLWRLNLKGRTRLSDFTFTFHFHALEKEMATHSSVLAWRIPGTGEPDGLPSMGSHRVGHDWSDLAAAAATLRVFL